MTTQEHREIIAFIAEQGGEYAGIPIKFEGDELVIHPSYRFAEVYARKEEEDDGTVKLRNAWRSARRPGSQLVFLETVATGKVIGGYVMGSNPLTMQFKTLHACMAWDIHAERKALNKLAELIPHHAFVHYMLTGAFLETSKRSGVTYFFRRLRPTLAIRADERGTRCLCALCLHPIGYYAESWAGCMVPTDEIVSHLMLMRGDEHDYWRQANQHPAWQPQSGL